MPPRPDTARPRGGDGGARPDLHGELAGNDIFLRTLTPGEHRAPCPECARGKPRPHDDALAVRIENDGHATWLCHRCQWSGCTRSAAARDTGFRPRQSPAAPEPHRNQELAQQIWRESVTIEDETALAYLTEV